MQSLQQDLLATSETHLPYLFEMYATIMAGDQDMWTHGYCEASEWTALVKTQPCEFFFLREDQTAPQDLSMLGLVIPVTRRTYHPPVLLAWLLITRPGFTLMTRALGTLATLPTVDATNDTWGVWRNRTFSYQDLRLESRDTGRTSRIPGPAGTCTTLSGTPLPLLWTLLLACLDGSSSETLGKVLDPEPSACADWLSWPLSAGWPTPFGLSPGLHCRWLDFW